MDEKPQDEQLIKSRQRVRDHGEVFTPAWLVSDMCDLVAQECDRIESRFLEPACGDGNFLAEVLKRKLACVLRRYKKDPLGFERASLLAVASVYGVDLLPDNVQKCRERLFAVWEAAYAPFASQLGCNPTSMPAVIRLVLDRNILCGDALTLLQANGAPIVFTEWSFISETKVKTRTYELATLLSEGEPEQFDLFTSAKWVPDPTDKSRWIPAPLSETSPIDYWRLADV